MYTVACLKVYHAIFPDGDFFPPWAKHTPCITATCSANNNQVYRNATTIVANLYLVSSPGCYFCHQG